MIFHDLLGPKFLQVGWIMLSILELAMEVAEELIKRLVSQMPGESMFLLAWICCFLFFVLLQPKPFSRNEPAGGNRERLRKAWMSYSVSIY